jgi:hypothetical protein
MCFRSSIDGVMTSNGSMDITSSGFCCLHAVLEIETSCFLLLTIANPKQTNGLLAQDMLEYSYNLVLSNKSNHHV